MTLDEIFDEWDRRKAYVQRCNSGFKLAPKTEIDDWDSDYIRALKEIEHRRIDLGVSVESMAIALKIVRQSVTNIERGDFKRENWMYIFAATYLLDNYERRMNHAEK